MTSFWNSFAVGASLLVVACSPKDSGFVDGLAPDFSLADRNPNSTSYDDLLSPRDHLEKVSGWYFFHAT
ncbi:MAG: hypothetical protein VXW32_00905 [Myxococcota bacterium]|nr:hypothetical protein [Myxococcota bacterium]